MSRSDQAFHTHTAVELVHLEFKSESRGGLVAERSCPHLSLGVRKLTGPFHFIFVELSFVKWIVLPSVFSLAVKLIVDKLSLVQRAWRVGELAPPIHLVPFPLPLIHGPVRRGVDTVTVPLQWTVTTMLVFSIISVSIGEDVNPFGRGWGCFFFLLVFFISRSQQIFQQLKPAKFSKSWGWSLWRSHMQGTGFWFRFTGQSSFWQV